MRFELIPAANGWICQITVGERTALYLASDEEEVKKIVSESILGFLGSNEVKNDPVERRPNRAERRRAKQVQEG